MSTKLFIILVVVAVVLGVILGLVSKLTGMDFSPFLIVGIPVGVVVIGEVVGTLVEKNKKKE